MERNLAVVLNFSIVWMNLAMLSDIFHCLNILLKYDLWRNQAMPFQVYTLQLFDLVLIFEIISKPIYFIVISYTIWYLLSIPFLSYTLKALVASNKQDQDKSIGYQFSGLSILDNNDFRRLDKLLIQCSTIVFFIGISNLKYPISFRIR